MPKKSRKGSAGDTAFFAASVKAQTVASSQNSDEPVPSECIECEPPPDQIDPDDEVSPGEDGGFSAASISTDRIGDWLPLFDDAQIDVQSSSDEGSFGANIIVGPTDDRKAVPDPRSTPYRHIPLIHAYIPLANGKRRIERGTACFVSPTLLLTAAHVVWPRNSSRGAASAQIWPGHRGGIPTPGSGSLPVARILVPNAWKQGFSNEFDFAALVLAQDPGLGFLGMTEYDSAEYPSLNLHVIGYPSDNKFKPYRMAAAKSTGGFVQGGLLMHLTDTESGQSGAPVVIYDQTNNESDVVAIHSGGVGSINRSVLIAGRVYDQLQRWINERG